MFQSHIHKFSVIEIKKKHILQSFFIHNFRLDFLCIMFQNASKKMPSTSRPRITGGSSSTGRAATNTPMSERQQMALLMQMTSSNNQTGIRNSIFSIKSNRSHAINEQCF